MMSRLPAFAWLGMAAAFVAGGPHAVAQPACTGPESAVRLYVDVENIRSSQGLIAVTLYADDRRRFLARRGSLYVGRVPAQAPSTRVCIHLPSTGTYALAVYHDADGNRRYNRNAIGMPSEPFGFSNNPSTMFGIPSFRAVRLAVPRTGARTTVRLHHP